MSIYEKPVRLVFRDMMKDLNLVKGKSSQKVALRNGLRRSIQRSKRELYRHIFCDSPPSLRVAYTTARNLEKITCPWRIDIVAVSGEFVISPMIPQDFPSGYHSSMRNLVVVLGS
jgi:hypothetical protein